MGDYDVHTLIEAVQELSEDERAKILGGNAVKLPGLKR